MNVSVNIEQKLYFWLDIYKFGLISRSLVSVNPILSLNKIKWSLSLYVDFAFVFPNNVAIHSTETLEQYRTQVKQS